MKITDKMDLDELAARMGDATISQARHMRAALDGLGRYSDTEDVPEREWLSLCEAAVAQARHDDSDDCCGAHMLTIQVYCLYTDKLLATHQAATNAECEAWADAQYGSNDVYWTYA